MAKSTRKRRSRKAAIDRPPKPYDGFPLCAANCGQWQKKIKGKLYYFGKWGKVVNGRMTRLPDDGWQAALEKYQNDREDRYANRTPRAKSEGLTVAELRGRFLVAKSRSLDAGEITTRTYGEYRATADRVLKLFGEDRLVDDLASDDFEFLRANIAKEWGPIRLGNEVQRVRTLFKYAYEAGLIDKPMRFGAELKKPATRVLRKNRAANGKKLFAAAEIRSLLDAASPQMKAMILLGVNAGFGNHDVAALPKSVLNVKAGWADYPRPKTGIDRRCPLWPETVEALKVAIAQRPAPKEKADADLVFVTKYGRCWVHASSKLDKEGKPKHTPVNSVVRIRQAA